MMSRFAGKFAIALTTALLAGCHAEIRTGNPPPPPAPAPAPAPPPPAPAPAPPPPPATPAPNTPMKVPGGAKLRGSQVPIPGNIVYDTGKATIRPESEPTLNQLKQFLDENPQVTQLRIEGHTDTDGDDQMNLKLSGDRAVAVIKWLESRGVRRNRLLATGFGEQRPLKPNDSPANKEQNRRTEFHVATLNGRNFLGRDPTGGGTVFQ
ncbi:MAG: OmpA family protein [Polyangiaceae bacterium]|nr:OmpA family protein [Polyangiaceae bacterium]